MQSIKTTSAIAIVALGLSFGTAMAQSPAALKFHQWVLSPPMDWNSLDCYSAGIREADVLANADCLGKNLKSHQLNANMWRISGNFWDNLRALYAQFARLDIWMPFRGPGHWADADMLSPGNIRAWKETGARIHFTRDERITLLIL